ncbi:hypothetical protein E2C01_043844 [Portunus trituberculatus]|uniref:Uncharacterized protein n=1 Tax=Portunus trituberculatus TaxID=210409 RepID=A0A5B7FXG5_PORTR|nr:hypothetical protein [Portunus trituberculatus]
MGGPRVLGWVAGVAGCRLRVLKVLYQTQICLIWENEISSHLSHVLPVYLRPVSCRQVTWAGDNHHPLV